jgi:lysozyme family protein
MGRKMVKIKLYDTISSIKRQIKMLEEQQETLDKLYEELEIYQDFYEQVKDDEDRLLNAEEAIKIIRTMRNNLKENF